MADVGAAGAELVPDNVTPAAPVLDSEINGNIVLTTSECTDVNRNIQTEHAPQASDTEVVKTSSIPLISSTDNTPTGGTVPNDTERTCTDVSTVEAEITNNNNAQSASDNIVIMPVDQNVDSQPEPKSSTTSSTMQVDEPVVPPQNAVAISASGTSTTDDTSLTTTGATDAVVVSADDAQQESAEGLELVRPSAAPADKLKSELSAFKPAGPLMRHASSATAAASKGISSTRPKSQRAGLVLPDRLTALIPETTDDAVHVHSADDIDGEEEDVEEYGYEHLSVDERDRTVAWFEAVTANDEKAMNWMIESEFDVNRRNHVSG